MQHPVGCSCSYLPGECVRQFWCQNFKLCGWGHMCTNCCIRVEWDPCSLIRLRRLFNCGIVKWWLRRTYVYEHVRSLRSLSPIRLCISLWSKVSNTNSGGWPLASTKNHYQHLQRAVIPPLHPGRGEASGQPLVGASNCVCCRHCVAFMNVRVNIFLARETHAGIFTRMFRLFCSIYSFMHACMWGSGSPTTFL